VLFKGFGGGFLKVWISFSKDWWWFSKGLGRCFSKDWWWYFSGSNLWLLPDRIFANQTLSLFDIVKIDRLQAVT
jgi:hypothetical protein